MILLIDNYDSFVYNLARYFAELGLTAEVVRNDRLTVEEIRRRRPQAIVISPGPCTPAEAGVSVAVVRELAGEAPILGVCLGHQAIGAAFGGRVVRAPEPIHGSTSMVTHDGSGVLAGLASPLRVMRYHSLIIDPESTPPELRIVAWTDDGIPMAVAHRRRPVFGVQFHPESVLTTQGHQLLANFARLAGLAPGPLPTGDLRAESLPADEVVLPPSVPVVW